MANPPAKAKASRPVRRASRLRSDAASGGWGRAGNAAWVASPQQRRAATASGRIRSMATVDRKAAKPRKPPVTSEILDRQPPRNLDAEKAVLGSILLLPHICDDVSLVIRPEDFYDDANRTIFEHFLSI